MRSSSNSLFEWIAMSFSYSLGRVLTWSRIPGGPQYLQQHGSPGSRTSVSGSPRIRVLEFTWYKDWKMKFHNFIFVPYPHVLPNEINEITGPVPQGAILIAPSVPCSSDDTCITVCTSCRTRMAMYPRENGVSTSNNVRLLKYGEWVKEYIDISI